MWWLSFVFFLFGDIWSQWSYTKTVEKCFNTRLFWQHKEKRIKYVCTRRIWWYHLSPRQITWNLQIQGNQDFIDLSNGFQNLDITILRQVTTIGYVSSICVSNSDIKGDNHDSYVTLRWQLRAWLCDRNLILISCADE